MKRFKILSAVVAVVLMVTAVSCTSVREIDDGYYDGRAQAPSRIYVDDPYRGTVVLERDPYSGRYYEIGPYSSYYSPYSYGYGNRYNYGRNYNNRNKPYYRNTNPVITTPPAQTQEQRRDWEKRRDEARKKVLGNSGN